MDNLIPQIITSTGASGEVYALAWLVEGNYVYLAEATPGTLLTSATWRVQRVDTEDGRIEWADGNANFDNEADDLTNLSYS